MRKKKVNKYSFSLLIAVVLLISTTLAFAQPVVPGFNVEVYANVPEPAKLAFDPSGVLYVGNNGPLSMEKIYRVGVGGSPVEEYGDTSFPDPDSVAFDAGGAISGTPGSVLVGNGGEPGYIAAILPDQSTITPIGPTFNIGNPAVLKFDKTGRLLVADQAPPFRALALTRTEIVELGDSFLAIAVDGSNRVYSAFLKNQIKVIASDGTPLPDLTPIDNSRDYFSNLEFGPFDEIWKGHLFATSEDSNIYRILPDGTIIKFGSGWTADNRSGLAFGPDGALYISDWIADAIYRITPKDVVLINDLVDFQPDPSTYSTENNAIGCPDGYVGKFNFMAVLDNTSSKELSNLQIEVNELSNNNVLLTTEGFVRQGERFNVPKRDGFVDGLLGPSESVDVPFIVCLTEIKKFRFFVDVFGSQ